MKTHRKSSSYEPINIFFSYAHEDEDLMHHVRRQLIVHERNGQIVKWYDRMIPPGDDWRMEIDFGLEIANIFIPLLSPAFIESKYCYEIEGQAALDRHAAGTLKVIPIILRQCGWKYSPFAEFLVLPKDGRPLNQWPDLDEATFSVSEKVMEVVDNMIVTREDTYG